MTFAAINYLAVLLAAAAAWVAGAVWYMALAQPWMAAVGTTQEKIAASKTQPGASLPLVFAFAARIPRRLRQERGRQWGEAIRAGGALPK